MEDRELDAWIAENVMEWGISQETDIMPYNDLGDTRKYYVSKSLEKKGIAYSKMDYPTWSPTQDLNACREAEMKLDSDKRKAYERVMFDDALEQFDSVAEARFFMMTRPAKERCEGMHKAINE